MLEAMQVYSPADSRRTPYVGRNHGDDGDDDFDDVANTQDAADDDDDNDDDLENKRRGADQDSTLQILLNPNALREIFLRISLGNAEFFLYFSCLVKTSFEAFCLKILFSEGKRFHIPPDAFLAIECQSLYFGLRLEF